MAAAGETGPTQPRHVREAYRRFVQRGKVPYVKTPSTALLL